MIDFPYKLSPRQVCEFATAAMKSEKIRVTVIAQQNWQSLTEAESERNENILSSFAYDYLSNRGLDHQYVSSAKEGYRLVAAVLAGKLDSLDSVDALNLVLSSPLYFSGAKK